MNLTVVHSTRNCADSTCPTIYVDDAGNYVIQGFKMSPGNKAGLNIPKNEDVIQLPADFLQEFIAKMK